MKRGLILLWAISLAFAGAASASVQQGDAELNLSGNWSSINGEDSEQDIDWLGLSAGFGYFLTDNIQIEAVGTGVWIGDGFQIDETQYLAADPNWRSTATLEDARLWSIGAKMKYHFMPTNMWVPYAGALIMWGDLDAEVEATLEVPAEGVAEKFNYNLNKDGWILGLLGGMRYELNAYNDFYIEYQYKVFEQGLGEVFSDSHQIWFGILHQFK